MCGIAGVLALQPNVSPNWVETILKAQRSRGPDRTATERFRCGNLHATVGHNRLAILDLSSSGDQPMWDQEREVCVIYNGEIYNYIELRTELRRLGHVFVSDSDTEVLIEAYKQWGHEALERINGPFAFALFDLRVGRMVLARDRYGVKPLYYTARQDGLTFASTCGVLALGASLPPNLAYVARGLRFGVWDGADADVPFVGMTRVAAGTYVEVAAVEGRIVATARPYYDIARRVDAERGRIAHHTLDMLVNELGDLLSDAVRLRFRADVPIAISLSGGLDSTAIASVAKDHEGRLTAFTFGARSDPRTEGPQVRQFSRSASVSVKYVAPTPSEIAASYLPTLRAQGSPFPGAGIIAQNLLYKAVHEEGNRVLLGGQGGDEVLMGYRKFQWFRLQELIRARRFADLLLFGVSLAPLVAGELRQTKMYWRERSRYRNDDRYSPLRLPRITDSPLTLRHDETASARQLRDITSISLPTLLRYEDGNSMAHSVESRLPFLDYRLVEFCLALPTTDKIRNGYGKWLLRVATKQVVPDRIRLSRIKRGFDVQEANWIQNGLGHEIRSALGAHGDRVREWFLPREAPDRWFSDQRLIRQPSAFGEATSLLWLAENSA